MYNCEVEDDGEDTDDETGERYAAAWCLTHGWRFDKKDGCPVAGGRV